MEFFRRVQHYTDYLSVVQPFVMSNHKYTVSSTTCLSSESILKEFVNIA